MNRVRRSAAVLATLAATVVLTIATATPAYAWDGRLEICLSSASTPSNHPITIYTLDNYDETRKVVSIGECKWVYDRTGAGTNRARVYIPWYDRYWVGQEGEGYGPCHNGPKSLDNPSDPPSIGDNGQYVKYKLADNNDPC